MEKSLKQASQNWKPQATMRPMTAVYMRKSDSLDGSFLLLHGMHILAVRIGLRNQPLSGIIPKSECLEVLIKSRHFHLCQIFDVKSSFSEPFREGDDECCSIIVQQCRKGKGRLRLTQVGGGGAKKVGEGHARWPDGPSSLRVGRVTSRKESPTPCHLQLLTATVDQSLPRSAGSGSAGSRLELFPRSSLS